MCVCVCGNIMTPTNRNRNEILCAVVIYYLRPKKWIWTIEMVLLVVTLIEFSMLFTTIPICFGNMVRAVFTREMCQSHLERSLCVFFFLRCLDQMLFVFVLYVIRGVGIGCFVDVRVCISSGWWWNVRTFCDFIIMGNLHVAINTGKKLTISQNVRSYNHESLQISTYSHRTKNVYLWHVTLLQRNKPQCMR